VQTLSGTRYSLPADHGVVKLDENEVVSVRLRGFFKGWMCVGKRKVSCVFLLTVASDVCAWVYCSKSRFLDVVKWVDDHGLGLDDSFLVAYEAGALTPMTEQGLQRWRSAQELAVRLLYGPTQGCV
jgi:hypothetical protein